MAKGGGGGQSGKVDYPAYMTTAHGRIMDGGGADTPTNSIVDLVEVAVGNSPFTGEAAYNPATPLAAIASAVDDFSTLVNSIDPESDWLSHMKVAKDYIDESSTGVEEIEAELKAYRDEIRDNLDVVVLPRFRGGMRDINAVMSSAFAIGEAYIEASSERDIGKFLADLRIRLKTSRDEKVLKAATDMLQHAVNKADFVKALVHYTIEGNRITIVANKEQTDTDLAIAEMDAKWDLDMSMYIGNILASISGASTVKEGIAGPSAFRSALGSGISGAGMGYMAGSAGMIGGLTGPQGAIVGGLAGLIMGMF